MNAPRRLYRCRHDRQLAGVASGMAEYLGLDPTVVRILWILSVFFGGFTILLYVILAFVMPLEPISLAATTAPRHPGAEGYGGAEGGIDDQPADGEGAPTGTVAAPHEHRPRGESRLGFGLGVVLVVFGGIALAGSLLPGWIAATAVGPAFVLALGIALVLVANRRTSPES